MKTLLLLSALLASANVFSNTCHISLYDPYNRPYFDFHSQNDPGCQAAARECYQSIRNYRLDPNQYKCYTISIKDDRPTQPTRTVQPARQTQPAQRPDYIAPEDREFLRDLDMGETVYFNNKQWLVVYGDGYGKYELMPENRKIKDMEKNVARANIAITRGCLRNICTKTSVFNTRLNKEMAVEAIAYNGTYVLKDIYSGDIVSNVPVMDIRK